jgi:hypothetical protein
VRPVDPEFAAGHEVKFADGFPLLVAREVRWAWGVSHSTRHNMQLQHADSSPNGICAASGQTRLAFVAEHKCHCVIGACDCRRTWLT